MSSSVKCPKALSLRRSSRRGTVLVCMLACTLIATTLAALTIRSALQTRREARLQRDRHQVTWLLDAGLKRASQALESDSSYRGEAWQIEQASFDGRHAEIDIDVSESNDSGERTVTVVARLGAAPAEPTKTQDSPGTDADPRPFQSSFQRSIVVVWNDVNNSDSSDSDEKNSEELSDE